MKNHEGFKVLGAGTCFDQSDPNAISDIATYPKGEDMVDAYDAISTRG